jgi:outer membrane lipoprotein-sorting protein
MKPIQRILIFHFVIAILLMGGSVRADLTVEVPFSMLKPADILKASQQHYDALTSYSDEGQAVSMLGDTSVAPCKYTIKMAHPGLCRITWDQNSDILDQKGVVWSAGAGVFLKTGDTVQSQTNLATALGAAAGFSSGATASVPGAFFQMAWANPLGVPVASVKRLPDAAVDSVDCFVLTREDHGTTTTLWIGKPDFFIHQVQRITSVAVVKARLVEAAKQNPQLAATLPEAKPIISTETHTHIVINQNLSPADFDQPK